MDVGHRASQTSSNFFFMINITCDSWQIKNLHSIEKSHLFFCFTQNYKMQPAPPVESNSLCLTMAQISHLFLSLSPFCCNITLRAGTDDPPKSLKSSPRHSESPFSRHCLCFLFSCTSLCMEQYSSYIVGREAGHGTTALSLITDYPTSLSAIPSS